MSDHHRESNKVSAAYDFAKYLPERRAMMRKWADNLDKLKPRLMAYHYAIKRSDRVGDDIWCQCGRDTRKIYFAPDSVASIVISTTRPVPVLFEKGLAR